MVIFSRNKLLVLVTLVALLATASCSQNGSSTSPGASDAADTSVSDSSLLDTETIDTSDTDQADTTGADTAGADTAGRSDIQQTASTLSEQYPGDQGIGADSAVLFFDDFETGWGRWDWPQADGDYLTMQSGAATAHSGSGYLRSMVTTQDLADDQYISSASRASFERVDELFWRFYARFPNVAPNPHHWVRVAAGKEGWNADGLANTLPAGDEGFWFDFDINNDNVFNFYAYWHEMRSGRCNNGGVEPGCAGDQGTTYYYGNVFRPPSQQPYPIDEWVCVEMRAKANTPREMDGELQFWIDDQPVGDYRTGRPDGTWLRSTFHTGGCDFSACDEPTSFEGFNFRTSEEVGFLHVTLDAYYQRDTTARRRQALEDKGLTVSDEQTIYYDDVVVATERIGCKR
jgi:hypothetical protein